MTGLGVFWLGDMIGSKSVAAGLPDGRVVRAVPEPFEGGLFMRFTAAWAVLTGRAYAFSWPDDGDLEMALDR
jgi:hypothetical protein